MGRASSGGTCPLCRITARSQTGATLAGEFPAGQRVLKVVKRAAVTP